MSKRTFKAMTAGQAFIDYRDRTMLFTFVNNTSHTVSVYISEEQGTILVRIDEDENEVRFQARNERR